MTLAGAERLKELKKGKQRVEVDAGRIYAQDPSDGRDQCKK